MIKASSLLASLLCLTAVNSLSADSEEIAWGQRPTINKQEECGRGPQHMRISARHIEGKGIGYNQGYTTLEAFLAPNEETWSVLPFLDVRGHIFDNGKWAANAGLGARTKWGCRAYGINAYYDYRSSKKSYNQIGVGLESLGTIWDFRINGYFPVGSKISHPSHARFGGFRGNNLMLSRKYELTMKGFDAEVGGHFGPRNWDLYGGVGPYYYDEQIGPNFWGGKARFYVKWKDYIGLQVSYSYDKVFKNIVQGEVTFSVPFGARPNIKANRSYCKTSCDLAYKLDMRMVQPVFRDEIMPLNTHRKQQVAIDPATGDPLFFVFVDNLSHSLGTFESPFNTLLDAQNGSGPNDIIYVFPGDGTTTGMDKGISLQDGQQFLGATQGYTFETTLGTITVPPQASGTDPAITNGTGVVVNLANNNTVSGFMIENTNAQAVFGSGIMNATISNNFMQGNSFAGVEFDNATGTLTVTNNNFELQSQCIVIDNTSTISNTIYNITNNQMFNLQSNNSIDITFGDGSSNTVNITGNTINNTGNSELITITCTNSQPNLAHTFNITNNQIFAFNYPVSILTTGTTSNLFLTNNTLNAGNFGSIITLEASTMTGAINNNFMTAADFHVDLENHSNSSFSGTINNNSVIVTGSDDDIYINNLGGLSLTIDGNTVSGGQTGIEISNSSPTFPVDCTISNNNCSFQTTYGIRVDDSGSAPTLYEITNNTCSYQTNGYGIYVTPNGNSGPATYEITNNTCSYQTSGFGIFIEDNSASPVEVDILNNTCSYQNQGIQVHKESSTMTPDAFKINNNSVALYNDFGINFSQVIDSASCLEFNNNAGDKCDTAFFIDTGGGAPPLNLVPPVGNNCPVIPIGPFNTVSSCP